MSTPFCMRFASKTILCCLLIDLCILSACGMLCSPMHDFVFSVWYLCTLLNVMSAIRNILSLASRHHGLHLDGLVLATTTELRNELNENTESLDENTLEKLCILSAMILPETEKDLSTFSEIYQKLQDSKFFDLLYEVWQLVLQKFTSNLENIAEKSVVIHFLGKSFFLLRCDDGKQCCKQLLDNFNASISCEPAQAFNGSLTLLQSILRIIEKILSHRQNNVVSAMQKEVMLCLRDVIVSYGGIVSNRSAHRRVISVFSKSLRNFPFDDPFHLGVRKTISGAFMLMGKSMLGSRQSETTNQLYHCLMLFDLLLEILTSKGTESCCDKSSVKDVAELLASGIPWLVIQDGLRHRETSIRKQALFNLRQSLFVTRECQLDISAMPADPELTSGCDPPIFSWLVDDKDHSFWRDFLLLVETLEENQLHVIKPVLDKLDRMIVQTDPNESQFPIHSSWICVLLHRMMYHESKAISKEGIILSLKLNPRCCPFLVQCGGEDLLIGKNGCGIIPALQDINLFCDFKDTSNLLSANGELPFIATLTDDFLQKCFAAYPNPEKLLKFLLIAIDLVNWAAVPMYYFCRSLLHLPECKAWDGQDLQVFQSIVMKCLRTHDVRLRHAILSLLIHSMTRFINCSEVQVDEVLSIIFLSNDKTFLPKFPKLYKKILDWLYIAIGTFKDTVTQKWQGVHAYVFQRVMLYCNRLSGDGASFADGWFKEAYMNSLLVLTVENSKGKGIHKDKLLEQIIVQLNEIIEKGTTHLYLPKEKVFKAIVSVNCLISAWVDVPPDGISDENGMCSTLFKTMKYLQLYIVMMYSLGQASLDDMKLCLRTWKKILSFLLQFKQRQQWQQQVLSDFSSLISAAQAVYKKARGDKEITTVGELKSATCSLFILSWICTLNQDSEIRRGSSLMQNIGDFLKDFDLSTKWVSSGLIRDVKMRGIIEEYALYQWSCVPFAMEMPEKTCSIDCCRGLEDFLNCLETVTEANISTYLDALASLIRSVNEFEEDMEELICGCMDLSWRTVQSLIHSPSFWGTYQSFVAAFFQNNILSLPHSSKIQQKLQYILALIMETSSAKPGMLRIVCETSTVAWTDCNWFNDEFQAKNIQNFNVTKSSPCAYFPNTAILKIHTDFITQCLSFSHVQKKEDLALQNALKLVDIDVTGQQSSYTAISDDIIKLSMISTLLELDPKSLDDCDLVHSIIKQLLLLDIEISKKKTRYHHNSLHHHVKNSIHQAVIMLLPFVPNGKDSFLIEHMITQLKNDAQPSVRYLMEWTLALVVGRCEKNEAVVMNQLTQCASDSVTSTTGGAKFSAICSYLTVALFIGLSKDTAHREEYFLKLVDICWPWCMSQHFSIRLYALAVVLRIQVLFNETGNGDSLNKAHPSLSSCLAFAGNATGNVAKNWEKIKDNFFLFDFHPVGDLSVETVYFTLPRLCGLPRYCSLEGLSTKLCWKRQFRSGVQVFNICEKLRNRTSSKWIPQESKPSEFTIEPSQRYRKNFGAEGLNDMSDLSAAEYNVQKKIMPWLEMAESVMEGNGCARSPGLILVASLIDKPSNLGGLTRTCEIFGAETLVVHSLACTTDKLYQSLSVTAHQWLPMMEVKPWNLEEYLMKMRNEGYTLVGTEQTAQSVCLSKYRFPKKCLLVLGNEKEGIPISILKVLDICVQIPQKGIVRSLNVHVSGAIAVWEYTRQHL